MYSEYRLLAMLTVCTGRTFRHLLLTVRNSAAVLDMAGGDQATKLSAFIFSSWLRRFLALPSIALPKQNRQLRRLIKPSMLTTVKSDIPH